MPCPRQPLGGAGFCVLVAVLVVVVLAALEVSVVFELVDPVLAPEVGVALGAADPSSTVLLVLVVVMLGEAGGLPAD